MDKKILFLGPLYPPEREQEIKENLIANISNAPNVYQWNLIDGIAQLVPDKLKIVNVLPVGTWRREYKKLFLKDSEWSFGSITGHEIGCINIPFLKQLIRSGKTERFLRKCADENTEIVIYSAYMPFLRAVYQLPAAVKITAIITDLPEFYDLGRTSKLRKLLRTQQNHMIYRYLERVDRFVVLTRQMCEPLHVGDRPWVCIEGLYNVDRREVPLASAQGTKKGILYSGTLHERFGIKTLLEAFAGIRDQEIELWICGSGEAETEIQAFAKKDERIKFFGFCSQSEVAELRSRAAILVNPRPNEGEYVKYSFPSKTMEYMASGKPVIMYKLDGIPDEYDAYLNYVPDTSIKALRKKIVEICEDKCGFYQDKAQRAQKFIMECKSSEVQAKKMIDMLSKSNFAHQ